MQDSVQVDQATLDKFCDDNNLIGWSVSVPYSSTFSWSKNFMIFMISEMFIHKKMWLTRWSWWIHENFRPWKFGTICLLYMIDWHHNPLKTYLVCMLESLIAFVGQVQNQSFIIRICLKSIEQSITCSNCRFPTSAKDNLNIGKSSESHSCIATSISPFSS